MTRSLRFGLLWLALTAGAPLFAAAPAATAPFPRPLESYAAPAGASAWEIVQARAAAEPFNVVATVIFVLAVLHTFAAGKIRHWAHVVEERHAAGLKQRRTGGGGDRTTGQREFAPTLAAAALAAGADGLFIETHPDPDRAMSDGPNMIPLAEMPKVMAKLVKIFEAAR